MDKGQKATVRPAVRIYAKRPFGFPNGRFASARWHSGSMGENATALHRRGALRPTSVTCQAASGVRVRAR